MKNNQNVLIAIVLSFLVILGWQYFIIGPKLEAERQRLAAEQAQTTDAPPGTVTGNRRRAPPLQVRGGERDRAVRRRRPAAHQPREPPRPACCRGQLRLRKRIGC
jgi:hypothetical protein